MWHPSENDGWRREACGICLYSDRTTPQARSDHLVPSKLLDSVELGNVNWQPHSIKLAVTSSSGVFVENTAVAVIIPKSPYIMKTEAGTLRTPHTI